MKRNQATGACWRLLAFFLVLPGLWPFLVEALTIARPNFGVPEFVEPGGVFRVEVKSAAELNPGQWSAVLMNDLQSWPVVVELAEYGNHVDNNTVAGYRLTVRVPPGVPPEVHQLVISHPVGGSASNKNAVGVVNSMEADFYMMHYADPQAESIDPDNWDTGMYGGHGSLLELEWHAPGIRLANPRFLFDTGDELDNNFANATTYEHYKDHMSGMGVPVLATRGNNDNTVTDAEWRTIIGVETYSITMGSFYICQKDYNQDNYTTWFQNDYAASFANPAITYRLFGQHYVSGGKAWLPPAGQYPGLMLVGHGHSNMTLQTTPYYVMETRQACNKCAVGLFNFDKIPSGWTCANIDNPWLQMMSGNATCKLRCQYGAANDGAATSNSAAITNELAANFYDGRVRFLMRNSAAGYQVSGGQILAQYAYNNGANMAVLVKVDIPATGSAAVAISAVDIEAPTLPANVVAVAQSNSSILVTWNASTDNKGVTGYEVYQGGALVGSPAATRYTDTGLTPSTPYSYTVKARDAAGNLSLASAEARATTLAPNCGMPVDYQAEHASLIGITSAGTYVNAAIGAGKSIEWHVTPLAAGAHELIFRYALGGSVTDRPMEVTLNGAVVAASYAMPVSGGMGWGIFADTAPLRVMLNSGVNTVRATSLAAGSPQVDYLRVIPVTIVNPDANGNGMPDDWETTYFGSSSNPLGAADYDRDHDGQDNLHEYLAGTDPTDPADVLKITSVVRDASGNLVLRWPSVAGKTYGIQSATDLPGGFHDTADAPISGTGGMLEKSLPPGLTPVGFYRILVVR